MTNEELIQKARGVLNKHTTEDGRLDGDVGAAVLGENDQVYTGVCVDTASWGLCAERGALAAMISDGKYKFKKIAAVWEDDKTGKLHVLPPCGVCREFMRQIDQKNMEADIVLGKTESKSLKELIPHHEWPEPID